MPSWNDDHGLYPRKGKKKEEKKPIWLVKLQGRRNEPCKKKRGALGVVHASYPARPEKKGQSQKRDSMQKLGKGGEKKGRGSVSALPPGKKKRERRLQKKRRRRGT